MLKFTLNLKSIEWKITYLLNLYNLELDSLVVNSAKNSTILCPFVQKIKKKTIVYSCCHGSHDAKQSEPACVEC